MKRFFLLAFTFLPGLLFAQNKNISCQDLGSGIFYHYPENGGAHSVIRREAEYQYETEMKTGDTTVWKIDWLSSCSYTLKYIKGNASIASSTLKVLKKHKIAYDIKKVTNEYYVFKGYLDDVESGTLLHSDTIWFSEKARVAKNALFEQVEDASAGLKKDPVGNLKFALLYIYRPGKLTNSLGNFPVYCNDNLMCMAKNNSGYIFKIFKEGRIDLGSRLLKDTSSVSLDIQFGKTYYVKSMIHWGITSRLYNFRLEMSAVNNDKGAEEFDKVKLQ